MATDFVLSGTLERLEEVDDARQVAAVCTISAQLVDTRTRSRGVESHGNGTRAGRNSATWPVW